MVSFSLPKVGLPMLRTMLAMQALLLAAGAALAIHAGPQQKGDDLIVITAGMVLVAAMAIQNAASRIHLASAPPTTLMTGSTTQIMIDVADLVRGLEGDAKLAATARVSEMLSSVAAFAAGCAGGAILFSYLRMWCFVFPPILAFIPILMNATREPV
jgi:uncharacterized membrane protein YoaK (UPF0700 family)